MNKKLYWSANGEACTFIGNQHTSGKLEMEYFFSGVHAVVTLKKKARNPVDADQYFQELLAEINKFPSVSHWLGNDLVDKGGKH